MRSLVTQNRVRRLGQVGPEGNLIRLGPGGEEQSRLFPRQLGHVSLESRGRRFVIHVVPDTGLQGVCVHLRRWR